MKNTKNIKVYYIPTDRLKPAIYNPRKWSDSATTQLKESIKRFGLVDPFIVNSTPRRKNVIIGGHFRWTIAKEMGIKKVPVVYINISDIKREEELNIRLNKNTGEWDWNLLDDFDESFLSNIGFSSQELDEIFNIEDNPEMFDLAKELAKLDIQKIKIQKGDVYQLGNHKMMCGDSTIEKDVLKLMNNEKADMSFTDPPYLLNYLKGKTRGKNPKNLRTIWNELEKHWKYRNTIIWHVPNRVQGFSAKYKFFNKSDIALVGTRGNIALNLEPESDELFQNEYENAIFATSGKPYWEGYEKGKKICPTDFIEHIAADKKSSGQGIIFGTKPLELLIPYIKVLTKRNDLIIEPFGGSGSTLIAAEKMKRRCYLMEKSPVYCEVIKHRWEKLTHIKAKKL